MCSARGTGRCSSTWRRAAADRSSSPSPMRRKTTASTTRRQNQTCFASAGSSRSRSPRRGVGTETTGSRTGSGWARGGSARSERRSVTMPTEVELRREPDAGRPVHAGGAGSVRRTQETEQAQSHLDLQGPGGLLPVVAEQEADAVEPLGDGVDMDVEAVGGPGQAASGAEVVLQRPDQRRAAVSVVVEHRAQRRAQETADVVVLTDQQADDSQLAGVRSAVSAAEW